MKYIITESQYNLINEQVKKIDLTKDNVETFCKPQPVPKEMIDREVPNLTSEIKSTIENKKNDFIRQYPEIGGNKMYVEMINNIISKIEPSIETLCIKKLYAVFGYGSYDDKMSKQQIIQLIYNELNKKLDNFFIKSLLKTLVNKKNVGEIKRNLNSVNNMTSNLLVLCINLPLRKSVFQVKTNYFKIAKKCMNAVVVVDHDYNKLPPEKQYNPKYVPIEVDIPYTDIKDIIQTYNQKINSIIDSFV